MYYYSAVCEKNQEFGRVGIWKASEAVGTASGAVEGSEVTGDGGVAGMLGMAGDDSGVVSGRGEFKSMGGAGGGGKTSSPVSEL